MRSATVPSWTFVMLIVMGFGFTAGAVAFFLFAPAPTGAIVGGVWLLMGTAMEFFSWRALRGLRIVGIPRKFFSKQLDLLG